MPVDKITIARYSFHELAAGAVALQWSASLLHYQSKDNLDISFTHEQVHR